MFQIIIEEAVDKSIEVTNPNKKQSVTQGTMIDPNAIKKSLTKEEITEEKRRLMMND